MGTKPVVHACCPQARLVLELHTGCTGARAWRMRIPAPGPSRAQALVSVIYCPWCGVELEEWRKLQRPTLSVVGPPHER